MYLQIFLFEFRIFYFGFRIFHFEFRIFLNETSRHEIQCFTAEKMVFTYFGTFPIVGSIIDRYFLTAFLLHQEVFDFECLRSIG